MGVCGPVHDEHSWTFDLDEGGRDPVLGIERLEEAFLNRFPGYAKGITVPAMVEVATRPGRHQRLRPADARPVARVAPPPPAGAPELYPEPRRDEIDEVMACVYRDVNNGVYRCGFAGSQDGYERAYERLFTALDD